MTLKLNEQQKMIQETACNFARHELKLYINEAREKGEYPKSLYKKAGSLNITGILIPQKYGGLGLSLIDQSIVLTALAEVNPSFAASLVPNIFVAQSILFFGTDAQREKYLPRIASGDILCTFAVTEPSGGSNWFLTNQMSALLNDDCYVLNGVKSFISNASNADLHLILARTNREIGPAGFSAFLIEKNTKGCRAGSKEDKIGLCEYATGELIFENCIISKENRLGAEGDGINIFQAGGNHQCIALGSVALGISKMTLDGTQKYAQEKVYFAEKQISHLENVQIKVAEMYTEYRAATLLMFESALLMDEKTMTMMPIVACMNSIKKAVLITNKAMELYGASGCSKDFAIGRAFSDAKTLSLQMTYDQMMAIFGKFLLQVPDNA